MAGGSRAAKKRAKKKQKQLQKESTVESSSLRPEEVATRTSIDEASNQKRERKERKISMDKQNIKKRLREQEEEEFVDEPEEVYDPDDDEDSDNDLEQTAAAAAQPPTETKKPLKKGKSGISQEAQVPPPKNCATITDFLKDPISSELSSLTKQELSNCVLNFLLQPAGMTADEFHAKYWEQEPLFIENSNSTHRHRLDGLLSKSSIKDMLDRHSMFYGSDLNVTRYEEDSHGVKRRVTLDLVPPANNNSNNSEDDEPEYVQADSDVVWDHYQQGCTIRLLCPHKHADNVHALLQMLELEWGCMVGANAYLTPPEAAQGFAPHYDDIEAYCLQLEGRKRWKVYAPLNKGETLPRTSSSDYTEEDLKDVKPVMDITLSPGDILYMPRGWIHQACTLPGGQSKDGHSLHLTISAMQQWAWTDLMELVLPEALNAAANSETSTALREGLPVRFLDYMGAIHSNPIPDTIKRKADQEGASLDPEESRTESLREEFRNQAKMRIMRVAKEAMDLLDASCDQISKQFMSARQPPKLDQEEIQSTSAGQERALSVQPDMLVRMVRPGVARLVVEDDKVVIYHCLENSREYHGKPMSPLEFEMDDGPAMEQLLRTTEPQWICVADLFHDSIEDKVGVTQALFDEGLLVIRNKR